MKVSSIYCNKPDLFGPVNFNSALNVVMAEIRLPQNKEKDTHNLGKTTLARMLDFCFLGGRDPNFFLFKYPDLFNEFVFFLEVFLPDGRFVTIRRKVEEASKISFKKHDQRLQNFSQLRDEEWDHLDLPFDRARELLDSLLDLRELKPWTFRNGLSYFLRSQDDYRDVFHLKKFASAHADWKPYLAHILGFNSDVICKYYAKETELKDKLETVEKIKAELGGSISDISKIEGILLLKQKEEEKKRALLDAFDFRTDDKLKTKQIVENFDEEIASLNSERYSLTQNRKKILNALENDQILFNPEEAQRLFFETGVLFVGQIKKDFEQLISFNKAITEERQIYLSEEKQEIEQKLKVINSLINQLSKDRSEALSYLKETDIFAKHKKTTNELVALRADILSLEKQKIFLQRLQTLRTEIRSLGDEKDDLQVKIETDVEQQNSNPSSLFSTIRVFFNEIIEEVIGRKALLSVSPNSYGHLEFKAEILDESGNATSADMGRTYKKLLCVAFDMAILRAHLHERFPKFVFHDGIFESLDDRKKEKLLNVIRTYTSFGIQQIITLIASEMPASDDAVFENEEIVALFHDEGNDGKLFRMKSW